MKKVAVVLSVAVLLVVLLVAGCPAPEAPPTGAPPTGAPPTGAPPASEVFHWRMTTSSIESDITYSVPYVHAAQLIEEGSNGRIKVDPYPCGMLLSLEEQVPAILSGSVEAAIIIPGLAAAVAPATMFGEHMYISRDGYEDWELSTAWGVNDILRRNYAKGGIYYVGIAYATMISLFSNFPMHTMDDFKGKLIWTPPAGFPILDFGAVQTEMPNLDAYMALKLGTIEGCAYSPVNLTYQKLAEVTKYVLEPYWWPASCHLIVNQNAWDALGPELQQQVQAYMDAHLIDCITMMRPIEAEAYSQAEEMGVQFISLPDEENAKLIKAVRANWDQIAAMDPDAAEIVEIYYEWMKYNKIWEFK